MHIKIHRGTSEIGGTCIEVWTKNTRILLDFGMPLVEPDGTQFNFDKYKKSSVPDLINKKILPDITGIYKEESILIDGVLISHPHQDHYGFVQYLHNDLKYFIGEAAYRIVNTANLFINKEQLFTNHQFIEHNKQFQIGDLEITPYLMDHSAFDSYAFLIEGEGTKLFYSGDFRGHGRKSGIYQWFLRNPPKEIDYLLLEGSMIGRSIGKEKSEEELQPEFELPFHEDKLNLVYTSGQNIDRLVTIYKACNATRKTFVVDPYIASILKESSRFATIQHPSGSFGNVKVMFPKFLTDRMKKSHKYLIHRFSNYELTKDEIDQSPGKYVLCVRPSMKFDLERMKSIDNGNFIYSLWGGYLKKEPTKGFYNYLKNRGYTFHHIHTSGHADIPTLKEFVEAIKPKTIIPIHTFHKGEYKNIFNYPVLELSDKQVKSIY